MSRADKSSTPLLLLSSQSIVYLGLAWGVLSLLFFLLFSANPNGEDSPFWYLLGTYILETVPFFLAALLCFRNWLSPSIVSGRHVWLGIGLGMGSWFIANLLFGWWELSLGLDPDVSPADLFYLACYVFLSWGMILAVLPRRLNLEIWQWITVAAIAALGIAFAIWLLVAAPPSEAVEEPAPAPGTEQVAPGSAQLLLEASPSLETESDATESEEAPPAWAIAVEDVLSPLATPVNFSYIVGDVFLLIVASTLLLAFWGGRFAQSWRMIAAAAFCLYIADMWFQYEDATAVFYESGSLLEVFYVFSGLLFGIGATLEYDVSSRSRRGGRRR